MNTRKHYEYKEPPLPYQNKPTRASKTSDTLGLFSYGLAFVVSVIGLATILFKPLENGFVEQDTLVMAVILTLLSSGTYSMFVAELRSVTR
jgi:hypothetical protein